MTRIRCNNPTTHGQCKNVFRSRKHHKYYRQCFKAITFEARPISSRERVKHGYRRNRSRRGMTARIVPKVIVNRNNRNKNANG